MTTHKVSELTGALLDAAVAKALGLTAEMALEFGLGCPDWRNAFKPSQSWPHGGPIIEREQIGTSFDELVGRWDAELVHEALTDGVQRTFAIGPTPLIAAMRAFVASKFGESVELP